jgi:hypothetical protein
MANQTKTSFECALGDNSCGGGEAGMTEDEQKVKAALARGAAKFVEALRDAGLEPVGEAGDSYDRGSCGHDRSPR